MHLTRNAQTLLCSVAIVGALSMTACASSRATGSSGDPALDSDASAPGDKASITTDDAGTGSDGSAPVDPVSIVNLSYDSATSKLSFLLTVAAGKEVGSFSRVSVTMGDYAGSFEAPHPNTTTASCLEWPTVGRSKILFVQVSADQTYCDTRYTCVGQTWPVKCAAAPTRGKARLTISGLLSDAKPFSATASADPL